MDTQQMDTNTATEAPQTMQDYPVPMGMKRTMF